MCRACVSRVAAGKPRCVPPCEAGDRAKGDGGQVGDGAVEQHGGGHLCVGLLVGGGGQGADQSEFGDSEAAGVTGSTVSSRTNAKAAREVCQGTWAWDRPKPRRRCQSGSAWLTVTATGQAAQ